MKNRKKTILLVVLLMAVGFAAVSTTLYINGQTKINANQDDFNVYYSDALVNGKQDLSIVESETVLSFTTTLEKFGEKYILDYDVTNGSKNYDAELVMECTEGNDYLTVTNEFDDDSILESLSTRRGKLTLEVIKSYAGEEDLSVTIACTINANAIERNNLVEGEADESLKENYGVGRLIVIGDEKFNVISETEDTITMLAAYVLGADYRQTTSITNTEYGVTFSNAHGWENTPGPKEINIQLFDGNSKTYINEYVKYLQEETGAAVISGDFITLEDLGRLGCTYPSDYAWIASANERTCNNSEHISWIINGQSWRTKSSVSTVATGIWRVDATGLFEISYYNGEYPGVRPVITISKDALK